MQFKNETTDEWEFKCIIIHYFDFQEKCGRGRFGNGCKDASRHQSSPDGHLDEHHTQSPHHEDHDTTERQPDTQGQQQRQEEHGTTEKYQDTGRHQEEKNTSERHNDHKDILKIHKTSKETQDDDDVVTDREQTREIDCILNPLAVKCRKFESLSFSGFVRENETHNRITVPQKSEKISKPTINPLIRGSNAVVDHLKLISSSTTRSPAKFRSSTLSPTPFTVFFSTSLRPSTTTVKNNTKPKQAVTILSGPPSSAGPGMQTRVSGNLSKDI